MTQMKKLAANALLCTVAACGGEETPRSEATITRDAFVNAYVELRLSALQSPEGRITESMRAEILAAAGLTDADLLDFVDNHARRLAYMVEVWGEIDDTMRALRTREASPASAPEA